MGISTNQPTDNTTMNLINELLQQFDNATTAEMLNYITNCKPGEIGVTTLEVSGWAGAIIGMRAALESYDRIDSQQSVNTLKNIKYSKLKTKDYSKPIYLGENDLDLMKRLVKSGSGHNKFRRDIHVQAIISMPRYVWSELDTYKIATTSLSESTMHKLLNNKNPITYEKFFLPIPNKTSYDNSSLTNILKLEQLRRLYTDPNCLKTVKNDLLVYAKRILPEAFIQTRVLDLNYETLANIYNQRIRIPHRLKAEWVETIGNWIKTLPYAKELILGED